MTQTAKPPTDALTLNWLGRLRWIAITGQFVGVMLAGLVFKVSLPWAPLLGIMALTVATNVWLESRKKSREPLPEWLLAAVLAFDVLALTVMLYWTGGTHNPFTSFYLVHIALAAMTLRAARLWTLVVLSVVGYVLLFFHFQPLVVDGEVLEIGCPGYSLHLQGMAVAFGITAAFVAAFVARLQRVLRERDVELAEVRLAAARNEQFAALATLSAGVAHELGSPLGTIAVASRELVRNLEKGSAGEFALDDALLIRQEVDRCRNILDRLSQKATGGVGDAPELFTAGRLVSEVRNALPAHLQGRVRLVDEATEPMLFLPLAPMVQAVVILVKNACESDRSGGPVKVEVRQADGHWSLSVSDRGPGLDAKSAVHAGEPFYTTKPPGEGMGLGLFLVRTMTLRLGGQLELVNEAEGGLKVTMRIPEVRR